MLKARLENFFKYRGLLKQLVVRDIKLRYRRSVLGILWSVLNPLFNMIIIYLVFSQVFKTAIENFPIYLVAGQVLFSFLSEATNSALTSITGNSTLIKKVYIPKYIFPMSRVTSSLVNLCFSSIAVILVIIITRTPVSFTVLLSPLVFLYVYVFALGLGLFLASVSVFFRDVEHLYGVLMTAWMYLTPIFYPLDILPDTLKLVMKFNPMYHFITYFRELILYRTVPSLMANVYCIAFALIMFAIGSWVFYRHQYKFVLHI